MGIVDKEKFFKRKMDMLRFIIENEYRYSQEASELIKYFLLFDDCLEYSNTKIPVFVGQILSKFGVFKYNCDIYVETFKLLNQCSFLEWNCCEVAAGSYPRLAELVYPALKLKQGSLTIYDPHLFFLYSIKVLLQRRKNLLLKLILMVLIPYIVCFLVKRLFLFLKRLLMKIKTC